MIDRAGLCINLVSSQAGLVRIMRKVFLGTGERRALLWRPSAPLCAVRATTASSVSDPPCCYCFYLCLLDGALRWGTLWHKSCLTPLHPLLTLLSPRAVHSAPQSAAQHWAAFPKPLFTRNFPQLRTIRTRLHRRESRGESYNCIILCRLTFFLFVLLSRGITSIEGSDQQCV